MTFPVVAATNTSSTSTASTSLTVNLPASIASGDLLVVFIALQTTGSSAPSFSASGWTQQANPFFNTRVGGSILTKIASGSEGSTVAVTSTVSGKAAHASYRITGATGTFTIGGQAYIVTNVATASANPDPPLCPASGGTSDDYLWIAVEGNDNVDTVSSYPTNYTGNQLNPASGGSGSASTKCVLGVANRTNTAASENPGTFTITASEGWWAVTMGIQPTAAVAPIPDRMFVRQAVQRASSF